MYVTTGSPVHPHFDVVVPIEHVVKSPSEEIKDQVYELQGEQTSVFITGPSDSTSWIREIGCDIAVGQSVLSKDTQIGSSEIGILASIGCTNDIKIYAKPRIGIAASGNEIAEASDHSVQDGDGKIRDSNTPMLISILKSHGFDNILSLGIVKDDYESIDAMFKRLTEE